MARPKSLTKMSLEALVDLRDSVVSIIGQRAADLRKQLSQVREIDGGSVRTRRRGSALRGRKVAAKYRSKKDPKVTWAGRGATPRWMREEMKARKLKKEAFLIR